MSYFGLLGTNDLIKDALGRQKVIDDYSLFHGLWTFDVPNRIWEEFSISAGTYTAISATGTKATSENGALVLSSGTTANAGVYLRSKRNPRYQPNRGHLWSSAMRFPSATADGKRKAGVFQQETDNGVFFELEGDGADWTLYAVRYSNGVQKIRQDLASYLPADFDPEKAHVYDIQFQLGSAGNYIFYIDLQEIYVNDILGTLTELSIQNPMLPSAFECVTDTTTELELIVGCVDITSEGGKQVGRQFASISTGTSLLSCDSSGVAMIAIKLPRTISYGGGTVYNSKDVIASRISSWTRDEASVQVYFARDVVATNLDGLTWTDFPDSSGTLQYIIGGTGNTTLDTAFNSDKASMQLVLNEWEDLEVKNIVSNPDQDIGPFYVTPGDIMIVAVQSMAGTDDNSTTLYLSEEI